MKDFSHVTQKPVTSFSLPFFSYSIFHQKEQATHLSLYVVYRVGKFYMNLNYVTEQGCERNTNIQNLKEYVKKGKNPTNNVILEIQYIFVQSCKI